MNTATVSIVHQSRPKIAGQLGAEHAWPTVGCARPAPPNNKVSACSPPAGETLFCVDYQPTIFE